MGMTQGHIQEASARLCEEFQRLVPLRAEAGRFKKRPTEQEIVSSSAAGLKKFYEFALDERRRQRLGLLGRARLAFALQQRLLEAGYAPILVKQVLIALLTQSLVNSR